MRIVPTLSSLVEYFVGHHLGLTPTPLKTHTSDLAQYYGLCEYQIFDAPWPWFRNIVYGLCDITESRIYRALSALPE